MGVLGMMLGSSAATATFPLVQEATAAAAQNEERKSRRGAVTPPHGNIRGTQQQQQQQPQRRRMDNILGDIEIVDDPVRQGRRRHRQLVGKVVNSYTIQMWLLLL